MFVRKKKNKSGNVSVQVIDKSSGRYKLKKTIGSSANSKEIDQLVEQGEAFIKRYIGQTELNFVPGDNDKYYKFLAWKKSLIF